MNINNIYNFIKNDRLISVLILLSFLSSLRALFLPITGDEITYTKIAQSILLSGEYSHSGKPSTITPSMPLIIAFFYTKFNPLIGIALARLFNLLFIIVGFQFLYSYLKRTNLKKEIIWSIILLTVVNNNFVFWSLSLYPEPILFCFFWMFIFFVTKKPTNSKEIVLFLVPFVVLSLTRYVYAVLGIMVFFAVLQYIKSLIKRGNYQPLQKLFFFSFLCFVPLLFWIKYIYYLEKEVDTGLSYFSRFKENGLFYNIKSGLGIIKHQEVNKINGIPAFISLFIPKTGLRSWILSLILILVYNIGFFTNWKNSEFRKLFVAILLVVLGFIFAGTGFSRYWLILLPAFLLGFYLFLSSIKLKDAKFALLSKLLAVIYVVNELRLDVKILKNYF